MLGERGWGRGWEEGGKGLRDWAIQGEVDEKDGEGRGGRGER